MAESKIRGAFGISPLKLQKNLRICPKRSLFSCRVLQRKTKCFQQAQLASSCSTRHGRDMEQAISTASEPARSHDDIVAEIVLELGDARGEFLVLSENDTRAVVMSFVRSLTALDSVYRKEWSRKQRVAEADYAQSLDGLLAELESKLTHPLAPTPDVQLIS
jgi:hypothetical protein